MKSKKLFIVVNVDWFFLSHRLPIALAAQQEGYDVTVLAIEEENKGDEIRAHGLKFIPLPSSRGSRNMLSEFSLLFFLYKLYKKERPDIVHHVAIKPVLYGSIVSKITSIPKVVNAVSGLGSTFINSNTFSPMYQLIKNLYRFSFKNKRVKVIAQNDDDIKMLMSLRALSPSQVFLIEGSGVDLDNLTYSTEKENVPIRIVLLARMLWDKGIGELVKAAEKLKLEFGDQVEIILGGKVDPHNASFISKTQLDKWNEEGNVIWIGYDTNIKRIYGNAHIAVLPSYREGLPKALIEAMAIGRPVVTTDVPGCRAVVKDGMTGFLVPHQDWESLHTALRKLVLNKDLRINMGLKGRKIAEERFSIKSVVKKTIDIYAL